VQSRSFSSAVTHVVVNTHAAALPRGSSGLRFAILMPSMKVIAGWLFLPAPTRCCVGFLRFYGRTPCGCSQPLLAQTCRLSRRGNRVRCRGTHSGASVCNALSVSIPLPLLSQTHRVAQRHRHCWRSGSRHSAPYRPFPIATLAPLKGSVARIADSLHVIRRFSS
jgi:hypothetical protein